MTERIAQYWQAYLATLPQEHPHRKADYVADGFGDSGEMADELGGLVLAGKKTATASSLWVYEHEGEKVPAVGDLWIVLDSAGNPMCITETVEIRVLAFNDVDPQFAYDEGEGDRSLDYWRDAHSRFFSRECARMGREFSETMPVVCERFRIIY